MKNTYTLLLKKLTTTLAVSGYEWQLGITEIIQSLVGTKGRRIGDNLVYTFGSGKNPLFISAHMDEVGFFISQKGKDFVRIMPIGDIDIQVLNGIRLVFPFNRKLIFSNRLSSVKSFSTLKVRGLNKLPIGSVGTFEKFISIKNEIIAATSLDNKVGCLAIIEAIKTLQQQKQQIKKKIVFCFSCREEVGVNGLMSAIKYFDPKMCIDIDSAYAQPMNTTNRKNWIIPICGKGLALQLMGKDFIIGSRVLNSAKKICDEYKISFQYELPDKINGGTNARTIMNNGYEILQVNIPVANQHSQKSVVNLFDIEQTSKFITRFIEKYNQNDSVVI